MRAILTFHSIDDSGSIISYPRKKFSTLLEKLRKSDIPILSLDEILASPSKQGVAITFDDGMRSVYKDALPILKEYNAPAHVFIATAAIKNSDSSEQVINIEDYAKKIFELFDLNIYDHLIVDSKLFRFKEPKIIYGNNNKIINDIDWKPTTNFTQIVKRNVNDYIKNIAK